MPRLIAGRLLALVTRLLRLERRWHVRALLANTVTRERAEAVRERVERG